MNTKSILRTAIASLALGAVLLTGCSQNPAENPQDDLRTETPSATAEPTAESTSPEPTSPEPTTGDELDEGSVDADHIRYGSWLDVDAASVEVPELAEELWGADRTTDGINHALDFVFTSSTLADAWAPGERSTNDYARIEGYLTTEAWELFSSHVEAGDPDGAVVALVPSNSDGSNVVAGVNIDGSVPQFWLSGDVSAEVVSDPERWGDADERLYVHVPYSFEVVGADSSAVVERQESYFVLLPQGDGWAIDSWSAYWNVS